MRAVKTGEPKNATQAAGVLLFATDLGWMAMEVDAEKILRLRFGSDSPMAALQGLEASDSEILKPTSTQRRWIQQLERYAAGNVDDLRDLPLDESHYTPFQFDVIRACRAIPYGETLSYGELAEQAGSPRAARAVGNVMRTNRFPLVVPCHRVVAAQGMGGYSGVAGLTTKQRLLAMERDALQAAGQRHARRKPR